MANTQHPLWDLPTRVIHWALVICLPLAWWSAEEERYDLHEWTGYSILVLVIARIAWGVIGSRHSRFADFVTGPAGVRNYLQGRGYTSAGHNPLGGWSVVCLLGLLLAQAVSGLFNSDDVLFSGPFYYWAESDFRDTMGVIHEMAFNGLLGLVGLHLLAVAYHQFRKREPLVQAMVFGTADKRTGLQAPVPLWWALVLIAMLAGVLAWLIESAPGPTFF